MAMAGAIKNVQATIRFTAASGGSITGKPFPAGTAPTRAPSLAVTYPKGQAGTLYISTTGGSSTATVRNFTMIPLTAGQTYTFTGVPWGSSGYRDIAFGTGYTYLHCSATPRTALITYYQQDN